MNVTYRDIGPGVAEAVRRSARREAMLIGLLIALLAILLALALGMLLGAGENGRWAGILCSVVPFLGIVPCVVYIVDRLRVARQPEATAFARLLADPERIERIVANHVTYRASGARMGSEHILHLEAPGEAGYCRLDERSFTMVMAYLSSAIPEVMARWKQELEDARLEASLR